MTGSSDAYEEKATRLCPIDTFGLAAQHEHFNVCTTLLNSFQQPMLFMILFCENVTIAICPPGQLLYTHPYAIP